MMMSLNKGSKKMVKRVNPKIVSCWISVEELARIERLIILGIFKSKSDFLRKAIRLLLRNKEVNHFVNLRKYYIERESEDKS